MKIYPFYLAISLSACATPAPAPPIRWAPVPAPIAQPTPVPAPVPAPIAAPAVAEPVPAPIAQPTPAPVVAEPVATPIAQPTPVSPTEVAWELVKLKLDSDISAIEKLLMVQSYKKDFNIKLHQNEEADALQKTLQRAAYDQQRDAHKLISSMLGESSIQSIRTAVIGLLSVDQYPDFSSKGPFSFLTIGGETGPKALTKTKTIYVTPTSVTDRLEYSLIKSLGYKEYRKSTRSENLTTFLKPIIGRALYVREGELSRPAVKKIIAMSWLAPTSKIFGVQAKVLFGIHAERIDSTISAYQAVLSKPGKKIALREFRKELKTGKRMQNFYRQFHKDYGDSSPTNTASLTGFWLRRMHDGTDTMLYNYAKRIRNAYSAK